MATQTTAPQSGTDYTAVKNPYATQYLKRNYGDYLWKFITMGGGITPWEKAEAERKQNYDKWEAEHAEQQRQEMYNSAEEQAERMRDAGINPNLSSELDAGTASESASPKPNYGDQFEQFNQTQAQLSDALFSSIQTALAVCSGVAQVQNLGAITEGKDVETFDKLFGISEEVVKKLSSTYPNLDNRVFDGDTQKLEAAYAPYFTALDSLSLKSRKRAMSIIKNLYSSDYGMQLRAETKSKAVDAIKDALSKQEYLSGIAFNADNVIKPMTALTRSITKIQQDSYFFYNSEMIELQKKFDAGKISYEQLVQDNDKILARCKEKMFKSLQNEINYYSKNPQFQGSDRFNNLFLTSSLAQLAAYSVNFLPTITRPQSFKLGGGIGADGFSFDYSRSDTNVGF